MGVFHVSRFRVLLLFSPRLADVKPCLVNEYRITQEEEEASRGRNGSRVLPRSTVVWPDSRVSVRVSFLRGHRAEVAGVPAISASNPFLDSGPAETSPIPSIDRFFSRCSLLSPNRREWVLKRPTRQV